MSGLSDQELDYLESEDDMRAYHEDQRRMLEEALALVNQLWKCDLITANEASLLLYFVK